MRIVNKQGYVIDSSDKDLLISRFSQDDSTHKGGLLLEQMKIQNSLGVIRIFEVHPSSRNSNARYSREGGACLEQGLLDEYNTLQDDLRRSVFLLRVLS
jgi:hypothetical protein